MGLTLIMVCAPLLAYKPSLSWAHNEYQARTKYSFNNFVHPHFDWIGKTGKYCLWHLAQTLPIVGDVVSNAELGRELSIDRGDITRVMKRLRELGLLMRGAKVGVSYHYKFNPAFFRIIS